MTREEPSYPSFSCVTGLRAKLRGVKYIAFHVLSKLRYSCSHSCVVTTHRLHVYGTSKSGIPTDSGSDDGDGDDKGGWDNESGWL